MHTLQEHTYVLDRVKALQEYGRLAHAYLFVGPQYIGKLETALAVTKMLNCESPERGYYCDQCPTCLKINTGNHPDCHVVEGQFGEKLKIDQVRDIIAKASLRPFQANRKVFILTNVDNLTLEAGNALLKTLEEPSSSSLLILTTANPENVLDTIRSRCHLIYFLPMAQEALQAELSNGYKLDKIDAHFLAAFAEGCSGKARYLVDQEFILEKNRLLTDFLSPGQKEAMIKELAADKNKARILLELLFSWFRDVILLKLGVPEQRLIHQDNIKGIRQFQQNYSFEALEDLAQEVVKARKMLSDNLNIKIALSIIKEKL